MTKPSRAAKAAAILCFTSGIDDRDKAALIYDLLDEAESNKQMIAVLGEHNAPVWDEVEHLDVRDLWENVYCLAMSIDECRQKLDAVQKPLSDESMKDRTLSFQLGARWAEIQHGITKDPAPVREPSAWFTHSSSKVDCNDHPRHHRVPGDVYLTVAGVSSVFGELIFTGRCTFSVLFLVAAAIFWVIAWWLFRSISASERRYDAR